LDFVAAVRSLAERTGIEIVETRTDEERRREGARRRDLQNLFDVCNSAAAYFHKMLREHPLGEFARAELERRGLALGQPEFQPTLEAFHVGYAPYGWDGLVKHLKASGLSHQAAEKVGLLAPRKSGTGHYDRFRHRLMFSIVDIKGQIIGFSGRALPEPEQKRLQELSLESPSKDADPPAKYVNCPESPIYKKREVVFGLYQARQALRSEEECVVVEGNFDVVSLHARGVRTAVAPLGTAFTLEQAKQIRRYCTRVVLLFDGDSAGQRATVSARQPCRQAGLSARVARLAQGCDPDDLIREKGESAVRALLRTAPGMLEHLIDTTLDASFARDSAQDQARKIQEVVALLQEEDDPALRALAERHADQIAQRLGVSDARTVRALALALRRSNGATAARTPPTERLEPPTRARSKNRAEEVGREILGALIDFPDMSQLPEITKFFYLLQGDNAVALGVFLSALKDGSWENPEQVLAKMPQPVHAFALARLAAPQHERIEDARKVLFGNVAILQGQELVRQKVEAAEESELAQREGDFERELELLKDIELRARQRHGL
jgi:DNA primase